MRLDVDAPVALGLRRWGGGLPQVPPGLCRAGATLPNGMPRHAPPQSSPCPALPWVEQGRARRQSHLGPGAGRCAPPDPMQKALHHLQKETLGCPSSPRCPARGSRAQGQRGQASSSLKAGTEAPLRQGTCFQGPGPAFSTPSPPRGTARTRLNRGAWEVLRGQAGRARWRHWASSSFRGTQVPLGLGPHPSGLCLQCHSPCVCPFLCVL